MQSVFGGPIHMPTLERLASEGLRYNQFTGKILKVTVDVKAMGAGEKAAAGKAAGRPSTR